MEWIQIETSLPTHPKVYHLADLLGVDVDRAIAIVVRFLTWVGSVREDGDLYGVSDRAICDGARIPFALDQNGPGGDMVGRHGRDHVATAVATGSPVVAALIASGFVDSDGVNGLRVHGWQDRYSPMLRNRDRCREYRNRKKQQGMEAEPDQNRHGRDHVGDMVENVSRPGDQTRPENRKEKNPATDVAARKKPRKSKAETDGAAAERRELTDHLVASWRAKYATDPTWTTADYSALARVVKAAGVAEVRRRWEHFLASTDPFYTGHPLRLFAGQFDRLIDGPRVGGLPGAPRDSEARDLLRLGGRPSGASATATAGAEAPAAAPRDSVLSGLAGALKEGDENSARLWSTQAALHYAGDPDVREAVRQVYPLLQGWPMLDRLVARMKGAAA